MLFYLQYLKKAVCIKPKCIITLVTLDSWCRFCLSFILLYIYIQLTSKRDGVLVNHSHIDSGDTGIDSGKDSQIRERKALHVMVMAKENK